MSKLELWLVACLAAGCGASTGLNAPDIPARAIVNCPMAYTGHVTSWRTTGLVCNHQPNDRCVANMPFDNTASGPAVTLPAQACAPDTINDANAITQCQQYYQAHPYDLANLFIALTSPGDRPDPSHPGLDCDGCTLPVVTNLSCTPATGPYVSHGTTCGPSITLWVNGP
jgi:hypothetical protein